MRTTRGLHAKSPEILFGIGVISFVGTVISACVATKREEEVLAEHMDKMLEVKDLPEEEQPKETVKVYFETVIKTAKLYAPAVIMGGLSLGTMFASHHILRQRNAQLLGAYTALEAAYNKYRKGVVERYGEEVDYDIAHGIKEEEIECTDEKGKVKKKKVRVADGQNNFYTRYFTKTNIEWKGDDTLNDHFFYCIEKSLNNQLRGGAWRGPSFVTLNDALVPLGFPKTDDGMVLGWVYDKDNPSGDNEVRIRRHKEFCRNEHGVLEECWVLDFNCDGNIYDILKRRKEVA